MSEMGTRENPVNMKLISEGGWGRALTLTALGIVPIAVAILMQNPALRQKIQMHFWAAGVKASHKAGKMVFRINQTCAIKYDLARM